MTHYVKKWAEYQTHESQQEIANRLVENLNKMGIKVKCFVEGFRPVFNGTPVLEYCTGELVKNEYTIAGYHVYNNISMSKLKDIRMEIGVKEYAVIQKYGDIARLGDYIGPAGRKWSGQNRLILENLFKEGHKV